MAGVVGGYTFPESDPAAAIAVNLVEHRRRTAKTITTTAHDAARSRAPDTQ